MPTDRRGSTKSYREYLALAEELDAHLRKITGRAIREAIDDDVSEAAEAPKALPAANR